MRSVSIETLQSRLSEYLRLVALGETVVVTDGDRVVAELVPPRVGRAGDVADAVLAGWLAPRVFPKGSIPPRLPVAPLEDVLAELAKDRSDR